MCGWIRDYCFDHALEDFLHELNNASASALSEATGEINTLLRQSIFFHDYGTCPSVDEGSNSACIRGVFFCITTFDLFDRCGFGEVAVPFPF